LKWQSSTNLIDWKTEAEVPCGNNTNYMFIDHVKSEVKFYKVSTQINTNAYNL